jgi:aldose 1-epimerase
MTDALSLDAGDARVDLAPGNGGAIARFAFRGAEVLRPASAEDRVAGNVRGFACYPLVPYSNRIANARLAFDGRTHAIARNFGDHPHSIHGVGWQRPWRVAAHDGASARLVLDYVPPGSGTELRSMPPADSGAAADAAVTADAAATAWPWPFRATQWFALAADATGATLSARMTLANTGAAPFPFGLGFHPFFPRTATTELAFRADAVWETDATQLPTRRIAIPDDWRFEPPRAIGDVALDNVFAGWQGEAALVDRARARAVTIAADRAAGFLVVYVPRGRAFLAVEPVTHMTDAFNRAARGEAGTGARILRAGAAFSCTMRISVRTLR